MYSYSKQVQVRLEATGNPGDTYDFSILADDILYEAEVQVSAPEDMPAITAAVLRNGKPGASVPLVGERIVAISVGDHIPARVNQGVLVSWDAALARFVETPIKITDGNSYGLRVINTTAAPVVVTVTLVGKTWRM